MLRMVTERADKNKWNTVMRDMLDLGEKYIISLSYHSIYLKQCVKEGSQKPHSVTGNKQETCWEIPQRTVKLRLYVCQSNKVFRH